VKRFAVIADGDGFAITTVITHDGCPVRTATVVANDGRRSVKLSSSRTASMVPHLAAVRDGDRKPSANSHGRS
jgi:hypothetical protein